MLQKTFLAAIALFFLTSSASAMCGACYEHWKQQYESEKHPTVSATDRQPVSVRDGNAIEASVDTAVPCSSGCAECADRSDYDNCADFGRACGTKPAVQARIKREESDCGDQCGCESCR
ncbi:MAG TPA: hypothetical protein VGP72_13990 [Planctomycetota bacterium]